MALAMTKVKMLHRPAMYFEINGSIAEIYIDKYK